MPSTKPPSGMRDYLPWDVTKRRYVIGIVESVFQRYGFLPLETPTMENLSTLLGKYGDEGDQLLFRVLQRGQKLDQALSKETVNKSDLSDMGLRYDLTVPMARVVAQYANKLPRIFKRYQIQPVWRADRAAKGRFREFYQCDVDITGTASLVAEVETINAIGDVLYELGFHNVTIALNHRVILRSMIEVAGIATERESSALVSLDKLDKIGADGVRAELVERDIAEASADRLLAMTTGNEQQDNTACLATLRQELPLPQAQAALDDVERILEMTAGTVTGSRIRITPALARGLTYYTGPIFEIISEDFSGSLGGGGRYDQLVAALGGKDVPAVGFSLGLERILMLMDENNMFPNLRMAAQVMICTLPETPLGPVVALAHRLRQAGVAVDIYPDQIRLGRQLSVAADELQISHALIVGPDELAQQTYGLKDLTTGDQEALDETAIVDKLRPHATV